MITIQKLLHPEASALPERNYLHLQLHIHDAVLLLLSYQAQLQSCSGLMALYRAFSNRLESNESQTLTFKESSFCLFHNQESMPLMFVVDASC